MENTKPIKEELECQAAAIPYRLSEFGTFEVLLVSLSNRGWGFPKGGIKKRSDALHTARMETLEEVGALGEFTTPALGRFTYRKRGRKLEVTVFALRVERMLARWKEEDQRIRIWIPIDEAPALVRRNSFKRFLRKLHHQLLTSTAIPTNQAA